MESLLLALISFGDSTVAVGGLLAGTAFLAITRNAKAAAILFIAVVAAGGMIGTLKTLFIGCDLYLSGLNIRFPSGHAALSASGLGTICVLIISRLIGWRRTAVIAGFAVVEAIIATTLVVMGFHTLYEVVVGLTIGGCAVAGAYVATRMTTLQPIKLKGFILSMAAVVVLIHVAEIPSRDMASILAGVMQQRTSICRPSGRVASQSSDPRYEQASVEGVDTVSISMSAEPI